MDEKIEATSGAPTTEPTPGPSMPSKQAKRGAAWNANEEQVLPEVRTFAVSRTSPL